MFCFFPRHLKTEIGKAERYSYLDQTHQSLVHFSSVQLKMVSKRSEKPIYAPSRLRSFPDVVFKNSSNVGLIDDGPLSSFQGRSSSASSFHVSLLQVIDIVMNLALCPQVVSQAPQHFRSPETQATCDGWFASQSICFVISLYSGVFEVPTDAN